MPQRPKRRALRIMHKITPIVMLRRPFARNNGRDACRTVTEHRREPSPVSRAEPGERLVPYYFPSQGVYENEQRKDVFHNNLHTPAACNALALHDLENS